MKISVIVPTYCESENLSILVPRIARIFEQASMSGEIIIVDDDSPDGTDQICQQLSIHYPLRLFTRRNERGLSTAVVYGLERASGDILVVMDADLSHPPEQIPNLVNALEQDNADFVIGSRYVRGASTAEDWGLFRWCNSKVATLLAWPLISAKDPMAGFFALRRRTFESAVSLNPIGYKIGLELVVKCRCDNIREVPIHFGNRLHGSSKLTIKEQIDYLRHLKRLYAFRIGGLLDRSSSC